MIILFYLSIAYVWLEGLSLIHFHFYLFSDFEILRLVTMDPSQLFGAWLDDNTFLGGCLEISLDRFATTVQIEAYEVQLTGLDKQHFFRKKMKIFSYPSVLT